MAKNINLAMIDKYLHIFTPNTFVNIQY